MAVPSSSSRGKLSYTLAFCHCSFFPRRNSCGSTIFQILVPLMGRNKQWWQRHPPDLKFVTVSLTLVVHVQAKNCGSTNPQKSCLISLMTWTQTSLQKMMTAELASSMKMRTRTVISIHPTSTSLLHPSPRMGLILASQLKTWTEGGDVWTEKGVRECVQTDVRLLQCRLNHLYP